MPTRVCRCRLTYGPFELPSERIVLLEGKTMNSRGGGGWRSRDAPGSGTLPVSPLAKLHLLGRHWHASPARGGDACDSSVAAHCNAVCVPRRQRVMFAPIGAWMRPDPRYAGCRLFRLACQTGRGLEFAVDATSARRRARRASVDDKAFVRRFKCWQSSLTHGQAALTVIWRCRTLCADLSGCHRASGIGSAYVSKRRLRARFAR